MSTAPSSLSATPARTPTDARPRPRSRGGARGPGARTGAGRRRAVRAVAVLLGSAILLPVTAPPAGAAVIEEIVAKINNRIITRSEWEERGQLLEQQVRAQHTGPDLEQDLQSAKDTLLANLITEALLLERAETIFDMDKIRQSLIEDFLKQQNIPNEEALAKALKEQGMTRQELEDQLIRLAVPNEIINYDVKRKISVSEQEMHAYYDKHQEKWVTPAKVTFREIVLPYTPSARDETAATARQVVEDARGGADFLDLVQRYSEAGTREAGGLMGPFPAKDLKQEIAKAAFALKPGEISDPIDTGTSFTVIRLDARTDVVVKSFKDAHDDLYNDVREEKFGPRFQAYLKRLWKDNHIDISPKYESYLVVSPLKTPDRVQPPS